MSIYKSPISGGQFVNQPPKRGAGKSLPKNFHFFNAMHIYVYVQVPNIRAANLLISQRRLIATLAQQHQSATKEGCRRKAAYWGAGERRHTCTATPYVVQNWRIILLHCQVN